MFYAVAFAIHFALYVGLMTLSHNATTAAGKRKQVEFWVACFATVASVALTMYFGWLISGGRWGYIVLVFYTFIALLVEFSQMEERDNGAISLGNLLGHGINVLVWGCLYWTQLAPGHLAL
jgi:hypothetical protein